MENHDNMIGYGDATIIFDDVANLISISNLISLDFFSSVVSTIFNACD